MIARGLGRSYGDPAVCTDGVVVGMRSRRHYLSFDDQRGVLHAESGASLADVIETFLPRGWFPPTVPGTKFVTIGGAIAADIHGKNHHVDGSFGSFVDFFTLLAADGRVLTCSRDRNRQLFEATVGGMGLTGIVLDAQIRLRRVPSAWCHVQTERARDLGDMLSRLTSEDDAFRYSVAWLDGIARGRSLGRGVLMRANTADPSALPPRWRSRPHCSSPRRRHTLPCFLPGVTVNPVSMRLLNSTYYHLHRPGESLVDFDRYFFPLDAVEHWNRGYGRRGFVQYQALFPNDSAETGTRELLECVTRSRLSSFLAVLKRSGPAGDGMLSYLFPGVTLALDFPNVGPRLAEITKQLDRILLKHDGRLYLAKDALTSAETIRAMYPRLDEFLDVRRQIDPDGLFSSDLSRRLGLDPASETLPRPPSMHATLPASTQ